MHRRMCGFIGVLIGIGVLLHIDCGKRVTDSERLGRIAVQLVWPEEQKERAAKPVEAPPGVVKMRFILQPGNLTRTFDAAAGRGEITEVQPGTYTVRAEGLNVSDVAIYGGSKSGISVVAGQTTTERVEMSSNLPSTPALNTIPSPDVDGRYTVTWPSAQNATIYVVEESQDASFPAPIQVYAGSELKCSLSDRKDGMYYYRAKGTNTYGESAWSSVVPVEVRVPPMVSITSPLEGSTVSGSVEVKVDASDDVGIERVEFYVDDTLESTDDSTPYAYTWDTTGETIGDHNLYAKAYDAAGNEGTSSTVKVSIADVEQPMVSITSPSDGSTVSGGVEVMVDASDDVGIERVEFYVDDELKSTDDSTPYSYSWDTRGEAIGDHSLYAKAYDAAGNVGLSGTLRVTVAEEPSPGETITVTLPGGATMVMVWIESGTFMMGSPEQEVDRDNDEEPQHEVTITQGFYLGKHELTQEQWTSAMETRLWSGESYVVENPNHPAVYISWNDMQEFIAKLNQAEGLEVYRLPTEAEWEYACRAGTDTRWFFGDDESRLKNYAWYDDNAWAVGEEYAHEVGTRLPNPWGLYDMYGNVWEWCWDWYGSYSSGSQVDPMGPSSGSYRVLRGGFFGNHAQSMRSANRNDYSPGYRGHGIGARLVRQEP